MGGRRRQAFALVELAAALAVVVVALALMRVLETGTRHNGWQAGSIANLHEFAAVTASYQADYADQFWSYTWPGNTVHQTQYADLRNPGGQPETIAAQATDIMRRRGRAQVVFSWLFIPTVWYHHLPLADYLDVPASIRWAVSPGDRYRRLWTNDPEGYLRGDYLPNQPAPYEDGGRGLYSSSYRVPQAFFCPDAVTSSHGTVVPAGDWGHYVPVGPYFEFGGRRVSEVAFTSQKVHVFDSAQWQGVRQPVAFLYPFARVPMLMVDGSAHVRVTSQANSGFRPDQPRNPFPVIMAYGPAAWDPPILQGVYSMLPGSYSYTRGGIAGRDFDGQEISTSGW